MHYSLSEIIVLFFTYSVVGWLWETFYCSIKEHHYAYRGFLFGPYCPVYGFAITTILITAEPVKNNIILLFIVGFVVASIFEYFASLFLEKVFHMKLWDYSKLKGSIQGRVAPEISLFWGIGVVFLVRSQSTWLFSGHNRHCYGNRFGLNHVQCPQASYFYQTVG